MKKIYAIHKYVVMLILLVTSATMAQNGEPITVPLSNPGADGKLVVHIIDGSISVEGHNGNNVIVEGTGKGRKKKSKGNKGSLRNVSGNSLRFTVEENNNTVYVKSGAADGHVDFLIKVPKNFSVDLRTVNDGGIFVDNLNGTHEVSNLNGKINMTNVGGSVIADALNQNITVQFARVFDDTAMMFTSLNGNIDVSFPSNLKANVAARSDNGDVYTDFELTATTSGNRVSSKGKDGVYRVKQEKGITGLINGGGIEITFKTLNGDVYIRSNN